MTEGSFDNVVAHNVFDIIHHLGLLKIPSFGDWFFLSCSSKEEGRSGI